MRLMPVSALFLVGAAFAVQVSSVAIEGNSYVSDSLITRTWGSIPGRTSCRETCPAE